MSPSLFLALDWSQCLVFALFGALLFSGFAWAIESAWRPEAEKYGAWFLGLLLALALLALADVAAIL